jgi:hypothetical protein
VSSAREDNVHSRITLILWHHDDHAPLRPVVELHRGADREARICFHEADDESSELVGCPECVVALLRATVDEIERQLTEDRWIDHGDGT